MGRILNRSFAKAQTYSGPRSDTIISKGGDTAWACNFVIDGSSRDSYITSPAYPLSPIKFQDPSMPRYGIGLERKYHAQENGKVE
jgi:hypothetical protein